MQIRTDLALEKKELWQQDAGEQTRLEGVWAREVDQKGIRTTTVKILDSRGEQALQKPVGTYITLELESLCKREANSFRRAATVLAKQVQKLLGSCDEVLVVGLGNRNITPDAIGPQSLQSLIVTRHLRKSMGQVFADFASVSAVEPGVLGATGVESQELVKGLIARIQPQKVIVVDALAAATPARLCSTIQLADTGITPGSGVGNSRAAFDQQTLGVPVMAIGVPTVMDASWALAHMGTGIQNSSRRQMMITLQSIDASVTELARVIGYGLNLALHKGLTIDDVPCFLS